MYLNTIKPAPGSKTPGKRLGRGIGSGKGKTSGKGHKGQKARSGGYHKVGFEGGQMPIQRRIPKSGFNSMKSLITDELRMSDLNKIAKDVTVVDLATLISAGLIRQTIKHVKIISFGKIERAFTVKGIPVTAGARQAIEAAGGKIEE
jgi:large subunit ribosomal protein L15